MSSEKISEVDGRIRGHQIEIEFNDTPINKPQELKLHHVTPLGQNLLTWLFVILYLGNIITNCISTATNVGLLTTNSTWNLKTN